MATTPATTTPALSNGQTTAQLADTSGVSQAEVMAEQAKFPELNPDVLIGNILSKKAKTNVPAAPAPVSPTIITSDKAEAADKEATTWLTGEKEKLATSAASQTGVPDGKGKVVYPDGSYQNEGATGDQYLRYSATGQSLGYGGYKPTIKEEPKTPAEAATSVAQSESEKAFNDYISALDARRVSLSDANKAAIDDIKATYERIKAEQRQLNEGVLGALTQAGIRSGRSKYAPEMEAFRISEEQNRGLKRLEALDRQALTLVREAETAAAEKDFELLSERYSAWKDNEKEKQAAITEMHKNAMDEERLAIDRAREKREQAKFEWDVLQEMEKPGLEADKAAQEALFDLFSEYPDAGIDPFSDSMLSAAEKVKGSESYQRQQERDMTTNMQEYQLYRDQGGTDSFIEFLDRGKEDGVTKPVYQKVGDELYEVSADGTLKPARIEGAEEKQRIMDEQVATAAEDKLKLLDGIMDHPGKGTAVGSGALARLRVPFMVGDRNDFVAKVEQMVSQGTLDTLLGLKAKGGTLGALNEQEFKALQNSATAIAGFPKLRDGDGNVVGYKVSEKRFNEELNRLKALTEKAVNNAYGIDTNDTEYKALRSNPEFKEFSNKEIWDDIQAQRGKSNEGSVSSNAQTGSLSQKYESGGDPGAIGYDKVGGLSYGKYQLAHQNAKRFVEQSPYAKDFSGIAFNSDAWQKKWKEVAKKDPQGFGSAQEQYIKKTHVQPQVDRLAKAGLDISRYSPALMEVVHSTAVQHGANTDVIEKALKKVGKNASEADLIKAIYDERWSGGKRFASSTPAVQRAVKNRFDRELKDALNMIG